MISLDVRAWATHDPERIFLEATHTWRRGEIADAVAAEASALASRLGRGFGFVASADERTVITLLAALAAGIPVFPLHPRLDTATHRSLVAIADVPLVGVRPQDPGGTTAGPGPVVDDEAVAAFVATSGTSGTPRVVRLPYRALREAARCSGERVPLGEEDAWLLAMPLAHVGGINVVTRCVLAGARVVLLPRFDADAVLEAIDARRVTHLSVVPTMLAALLDSPRAGALASLKAVLVGGAGCPVSLLERSDHLGAPVLVTYGMTETCSQIATSSPGDRGRRRPHHAGRPLDGTVVRVVDGERALASGEPGTIEVASPAAMLGYVGEPLLESMEFQRTGDRGYLDASGELFVIGRVDDVIVTGGENVDPLRVEALLASVPGVAAALVAGVPDARFGEVVGAMLVLTEGATETDVRAQVVAAFSTHERPRVFSFVAALPVAPSGKPDRGTARAVLRRWAEPRGD